MHLVLNTWEREGTLQPNDAFRPLLLPQGLVSAIRVMEREGWDMKVNFGICLYPVISADLPPKVAYEYALQQVRAARDSGFHGIFASQHYATGKEQQMFQPVPLLARAAAEAPGMTFGTAVYLLSQRNPVHAAEEAATLDIITGGQFVFGVGQGYRDVEFASLDIPKSTRGRRLAEGVQVLRLLWGQDSVTWDGEFYHLRDVTINPKP
ncbi:MAG: LLM class flavin-dependent oxidoreductase, partial [Chloroflexi bacterium]|nr:LLM class flavin-dependent oxidoreductase [Chloroflexota bacterium]